MNLGVNLSVVIITKNEAHCITQCLASVDFADEIVILDSGSTDGTIEIAKSMGARVFSSSDWPGFGLQKNRALGLARGKWVLSIDADEIVQPQLKSAILQAVGGGAGGDTVCYWIKRRSLYCGKVIRFGDWRNDRVLRLFLRGAACFSDDLVHERVICQGACQTLPGFLWHESVISTAEFEEKVLRYARLGAVKLRARGKGGALSAVLHGGWSFFRGYFLRGGFIDGWRGLVIAFQNARGTFLRYLWAARPADDTAEIA
ncbi:MAG: glycosyltransferase family 2 protein [Rugosibacter sp.]|nr:(heptosyl)LPS beta-1,4-glucosyltransferase [Rugosibacter sp.]